MSGQTNALFVGIGTRLRFSKATTRTAIVSGVNPTIVRIRGANLTILPVQSVPFWAAVNGEGQPWITGADLRQALEVAIAAKRSAIRNSVPIKLPLEDRSLALYPRPYRWLGGDVTGRPQSIEEATG